ncbi:putative defense protein [Ischnura elegans]|uniref:putative defense protein n=1 Tax=Ischnura elegans TaxID=197161 RepID=UPI001ED89736|nr:putative defense protein [Ischnura elegans]
MKIFLALSVYCCVSYVALSATIPLHKKSIDPNHVPSSVCESMVPLHNDSVPSTTPPPYTITASKVKTAPGEVIEVHVKGIDGAKFLGLYMQARLYGAGAEAVGKFVPENLQVNSAIRISSCLPGSENAISYISREAVDDLRLQWEVPEDMSGKVYFKATFVESFSKFWVDVDSDPVEISAQTLSPIPVS